MLPDRRKYNEEGHIGNEFFQDAEYEKERQCMTVESVVQRQILSLPEALDAYEVTKEAFENYLAKKYQEDISKTLFISHGVIDLPMYFKVMIKLVHHIAGKEHSKKVAKVDRAMDELFHELDAEDGHDHYSQIAE